MSSAAAARTAEIKARSTEQVKADATRIYAKWGLSLSDAINIFLVKSVEVGGLPFDLRQEPPAYEDIASRAYKAPLNTEGVTMLPAEWDDDE